jgi:hypothetical protein
LKSPGVEVLKAFLAAIAVLLVSCSGPTDDSAAVIIPEEATVVARFIPARVMAHDANDVKEAVSALMRRNDASRPLRRLIDKLLDGPLQVGVSADMPVYYYSTLSGEWAVVGSVDSRRRLNNALGRLVADEHLQEIVQQGGFSMLQRDSILLLFNDNYFYLGKPNAEPETTASSLSRRADDGLPWGGNSLFDILNSKEGDIQLVVAGAGLAAACNLGTIGEALPNDTDLSHLDLLADVSLAQGEATITVTLLPQSNGWQEFISKADEASLPLEGSQARFMPRFYTVLHGPSLPADGLTLLVNTNGTSLYDALESLARAAHAADEGTLSKLRSVCDEVRGTMEANFSRDGSVCAYMATTDTFLTHLVRELVLSDDSTLTLAPSQYAFDLDSLSQPSSFFGRDRGYTYLVTGGRQPFTVPLSSNAPLPCRGKATGRRRYVGNGVGGGAGNEALGRGFYLNATGSYFSDSCFLRRFTQTQAYYNGNGNIVIVLSASGRHASPIAALLDTE